MSNPRRILLSLSSDVANTNMVSLRCCLMSAMGSDEIVGCGAQCQSLEYYWLKFLDLPWQKHTASNVVPPDSRPCGRSDVRGHLRLCIRCAKKYGIEW